MSLKYPDSKSRGQWPPNKMLSDLLRIPVEQAVSRYAGRKWEVKDVRDFADFASHPAIILSDGSFAVFAKLSEAANGLEQFQIEAASLRLLAERAGVLTPKLMDDCCRRRRIGFCCLKRYKRSRKHLTIGESMDKRWLVSIE